MSRFVTLVVLLMIALASPRAADQTPRPLPLSSTSSWLPRGVEALPPELLELLRTNPYAFFRIVNRTWASRVCEAFGNRQAVVRVRLHGDAHVEQYAITDTAFGLDDFDDTAEGPATIDLVRFIGSIIIATHERGWDDQAAGITDQFLRGYQLGLNDPSFVPDVRAFVQRLRQTTV